MKSFCIKTNNKEIIDYLLKNLETSSLENIYFIHRKFKCYENVIVHYKGFAINNFFVFLSTILTNCVLTFYEATIIKRLIHFHYFYFDEFEQKLIEQNCYKQIILDENNNFKFRKNEIETCILNYLGESKSMILDGFVCFRLPSYQQTLEELVDSAVNEYMIEKEYTEFINLLKLYIDSKEALCSLVHLVYINGESILLNQEKSIIHLDDNIFNAKYLSDISFSSNDYALNALLTLLPKRIEIHLIGYEDEFINTLKLIFGSRIFICTDCNICHTYRILNNVN